MKKYLVSCATKEFFKKQKVLNKSALKFGIDETFSYTDKIIEETDFYKNNKKIFSKLIWVFDVETLYNIRDNEKD